LRVGIQPALSPFFLRGGPGRPDIRRTLAATPDMPRSLRKGPYVFYKLQRKVDALNESNKKKVIKTWSRDSLITPDFVATRLLCTTADSSSRFT